MVKSMERGNNSTQMVNVNMLENTLMVNGMETDKILTLMEAIKGVGSILKEMEEESKFGLMEIDIKEIG